MDPNAVELALAQTRQTLEAENYQQAFEALRPVLEYDAGRLTAWFLVGELCVAARQAEAAERAFSFAVCIEPRDVGARRMRAYNRYWNGHYDAALDDLNFLVRERLLPADSETVLRLRSDCYYGMARYSWALDDVNEAVIRYPHEESGRKWRDEMMRRLLRESADADAVGAHLEALELHRIAAEEGASTDDLPPLDAKMQGWSEVDLRCLHARGLENAGREDDALDAVRVLTARHDDSSFCCYVVGEIYWRRRDFERARYWTERALALAPTGAAALWQLSEIEAESARREMPAQRLQTALRLQLQAAHREDETALGWMQAEWNRDFTFLGEVDFLAILNQNGASEGEDEPIDPRPSAHSADWDQILENPDGDD